MEAPWVEARRRDCRWYFRLRTCSYGGPQDPSVLTHTFERLSKKAGVKGVRLHDLRHFHASILLQMQVHPKVVQERLGHATISITLDTYSHLIPSMQADAADAFAGAMAEAKTAR